MFRNGENPDDTLLTEPVDEVLQLGIPIEGEGKVLFDPLRALHCFIFDVLILI